MTADRANVSIVIATLGRPDRLATVLDSVRRCDPPPFETIVVDGDEACSGRAVVDALSGATLRCRYIPASPGLPHQRNVGLDAAATGRIGFLDDDVTVDASIFRHVCEAFEARDVVGVTGHVVERETRSIVGKHSPVRMLIPGGGREGHFTRYGYPRRLVHLDRPQRIRFMHGSCMFVRTDVGREVRFDERLGGYALGEDEDFSYRVSAHGGIVYDPRIVVYHAKEGFGGRDLRTFNRTVVLNRAYLFRKNFPQTPLARLQFSGLVAMLVVHRVLNREWGGAVGLLEGWARARAWSSRPVALR